MDYPSTILAETSLVAYWRLRETSGTSAVEEKAARNGTYTNGPTLGSVAGPLGVGGFAASFDGTNDYVTVPTATAFDLADVFSIEFWVKLNAPTASFRIVGKDTTKSVFTVRYSVSGQKFGLYDGGTVICAESGTTLTSDTNWHHFVITKNGAGTVKIYKDGTDVTGSDTGATLRTTASVSTLAIGASYDGSGEFAKAAIAEVSIYNAVLTSGQVTSHRNAGLAANASAQLKMFAKAMQGQWGTSASHRVDLLTDTIKCALIGTGWTPNQGTDEFFSTPQASEVAGVGYAAGGVVLGSKTLALSGLNTVFDFADPFWASPLSVSPRYVVLYKDTGNPATSPLLSYGDFGSAQAIGGGSLTLSVDATGAVKIAST